MQSDVRVGIGYDIHRLVAGRRLLLGGIEVPFDRGLAGHSDADVVLHAVMDALLGAAGLPDIGELFPDTDEAFRGADSRELLRLVMQRVHTRGVRPHNVDVIVHAEAPKLTPHKRAIAESIAELLNLPADRVGVKAKTGEGLGAVGTGEAIACTAAALLVGSPRSV
ncbi:MAG TPA: 2-C-methyl-D-erythritol 2,4-cyclodiphosphate synthase [Phycisphaerae bacterium]|nr:2-C-methyl-D-erythritol 2,4-cyclodiphosphate synthase [Phycisphaerae bacterium]HNU43738.1 2-C-methyl-D-erythritol 2,4-cyclodiphosphate synthase [Phycisphaerae bacterium]